MTPELIYFISYQIMAILAVMVIAFSVLFLKKIIRKEDTGEIRGVLVRVFSIIMVGTIFYALSIFMEAVTLLEPLSQLSVIANIFDLFWLVGAGMVTFAFIYFSYYMYNSHNELKKGIIIMVVSAVVIISVVYYMLQSFVMGAQVTEGTMHMAVAYIYSMISAVLVVSTISVYQFFRQFKKIGMPLLLLSVGFLVGLIGALVLFYSYTQAYSLGRALASVLFVVGYSFAVVAFYKFLKTCEGPKTKNK